MKPDQLAHAITQGVFDAIRDPFIWEQCAEAVADGFYRAMRRRDEDAQATIELTEADHILGDIVDRLPKWHAHAMRHPRKENDPQDIMCELVAAYLLAIKKEAEGE